MELFFKTKFYFSIFPCLSFGVSLWSLTSTEGRNLKEQDLSGLTAVRDDNLKETVRDDKRSIADNIDCMSL
jgi:hypothetical protein